MGNVEKELAAIQQRIDSDLEALPTGMRKDLEQLHGRLSAELKVEVRALSKKEQNNIVALDEQLWIIDQRVGQRIDELSQRTNDHERLVNAVAADVWGWDNANDNAAFPRSLESDMPALTSYGLRA